MSTSFTVLRRLMLLLPMFSIPTASAEPLMTLWGHEGTHCITGVSKTLCEISKGSESGNVAGANTELLKLEKLFEADDEQRPAYRSLLYLSTKQTRMEANGSGATDSIDDPDSTKLDALRIRALDAFAEGSYDRLPYLPIPLLMLIDHNGESLRQQLVKATFEMRAPLDLESVSFLAFLASRIQHIDAPAASSLLEQTYTALAKLKDEPQTRSMKVGLLLRQATTQRPQFGQPLLQDGSYYGLELLNQALVMLYSSPGIASEDFRSYYNTAAGDMDINHAYLEARLKKEGGWNDTVESKMAQADAMLELMKLTRPEDAVREVHP